MMFLNMLPGSGEARLRRDAGAVATNSWRSHPTAAAGPCLQRAGHTDTAGRANFGGGVKSASRNIGGLAGRYFKSKTF